MHRQLVFLVLATVVWAGGTDVGGILRQAGLHLRKGERSEALALLQSAVTKNPDALEAHILYQDVKRAAGEEASLLEEYKARMEKAPDDIGSRFLYARLLKGGKAIAELQRIVRAEPGLAHAWAEFARAQRKHGRLVRAEKAARKAIQLNPRLARGHEILGWILERRGFDEAAEASYRLALSVDGDLLSARYKLAHLFARGKRGDAALDEIRAARRQAPGDPQVHVHHGLVLSALGRSEQAAAAYRKAVDGSVADPLVLVLLAESYAELSEWALAERAVVRALAASPDLAAAHAARGYAALRQGNYARARDYYREAKSLQSRDASYRYYLGLIEEKQGNGEAALREYRAAVTREMDNPAYRIALGAAYERLGRSREALAAYRQATRLAPGDAVGWARYGHAAADARKPKLAVRAFLKAHEAAPDDTGVMLSLGVAYETGLRKPKKAAEFYRKYLAAGGKDTRVAGWLEAIEGKGKK